MFACFSLFRQDTAFLQRKREGEERMNIVFSGLSPAEKAQVNSLCQGITCKGLNKRTVKEAVSRAVRDSRGLGLSEDQLTARIEAEIGKSEDRAKTRRKDNIVSDAPEKLVIYKGLVTTSLLSVNHKNRHGSQMECLEWTMEDEDVTRKQVRFPEIAIMSAIYTLIDNEDFLVEDGFKLVKAEDVYSLLHPTGDYKRDKTEFIDLLNDTIRKFESLKGVYHEYATDVDSGEKIDHRTMICEGSWFFFEYANNRLFDENGHALFAESKYQKICKRQNRMVTIPTKYLTGDSLKQDCLLAYLVYRHESKDESLAIQLATLKTMLKQEYREMFDNDTRVLQKLIRKKLKPLFGKVKVNKEHITWEKEQ
jgi:hypothetical protein